MENEDDLLRLTNEQIIELIGDVQPRFALMQTLVQRTPRRLFDPEQVLNKRWNKSSKRRRENQSASQRVEELSRNAIVRRLALGLTTLDLTRKQMDGVLQLLDGVRGLAGLTAYTVDEIVAEVVWRLPIDTSQLAVHRVDGEAMDLVITDPILAIADMLIELQDSGVDIGAACRYRPPAGGARCVPAHCNEALAYLEMENHFEEAISEPNNFLLVPFSVYCDEFQVGRVARRKECAVRIRLPINDGATMRDIVRFDAKCIAISDVLAQLCLRIMRHLENGVRVQRGGRELKFVGTLYDFNGDMELRWDVLGLRRWQHVSTPAQNTKTAAPAALVDLPVRNLPQTKRVYALARRLIDGRSNVGRARDVLKLMGVQYQSRKVKLPFVFDDRFALFLRFGVLRLPPCPLHNHWLGHGKKLIELVGRACGASVCNYIHRQLQTTVNFQSIVLPKHVWYDVVSRLGNGSAEIKVIGRLTSEMCHNVLRVLPQLVVRACKLYHTEAACTNRFNPIAHCVVYFMRYVDTLLAKNANAPVEIDDFIETCHKSWIAFVEAADSADWLPLAAVRAGEIGGAADADEEEAFDSDDEDDDENMAVPLNVAARNNRGGVDFRNPKMIDEFLTPIATAFIGPPHYHSARRGELHHQPQKRHQERHNNGRNSVGADLIYLNILNSARREIGEELGGSRRRQQRANLQHISDAKHRIVPDANHWLRRDVNVDNYRIFVAYGIHIGPRRHYAQANMNWSGTPLAARRLLRFQRGNNLPDVIGDLLEVIYLEPRPDALVPEKLIMIVDEYEFSEDNVQYTETRRLRSIGGGNVSIMAVYKTDVTRVDILPTARISGDVCKRLFLRVPIFSLLNIDR